jgi:eukaryotic-like serine/threonine-protein kinase
MPPETLAEVDGLAPDGVSGRPSAHVGPPRERLSGEVGDVGAEDEGPPLKSLGKFQFLERVGRGGMGDVYLAFVAGSTGFRKLVVVKLLRESFAAYPESREMFLDEGRLAARLNHPNVVQTNEVGVERGRHYMVMEYLEGQPLDQLIARSIEAAVDVPNAIWLRVALDALSGLHHAHELRDYDGTPFNVVHRDLSPHNFFLTYEGAVKLLDFGIAKAAMRHSSTRSGVIKGKPAYMAPEQLMGLAVDRRADLYVFGIVLWELFTRQRLFTGTVAECLRRHLLNDVPRVSSLVRGFDRALDDVIARALDPDPTLRFQTARAMRDALAAAAAAAGPIPTSEAVGELLGDLFRREREERRQAVRRYVNEYARESAAPAAGHATPEGVALPSLPGGARPWSGSQAPQASRSTGAPRLAASPGFPPPALGFPPPALGFPPPALGFAPPPLGFAPPALGFAPPALGLPPSAVSFLPPAPGFLPPALGLGDVPPSRWPRWAALVGAVAAAGAVLVVGAWRFGGAPSRARAVSVAAMSAAPLAPAPSSVAPASSGATVATQGAGAPAGAPPAAAGAPDGAPPDAQRPAGEAPSDAQRPAGEASAVAPAPSGRGPGRNGARRAKPGGPAMGAPHKPRGVGTSKRTRRVEP